MFIFEITVVLYFIKVIPAVIVPEMRMCWNFPGMEFMI
jgi:hypothetical protein